MSDAAEREGLDPLLDVEEVARALNVPVRTVYSWRSSGHGPTGFRVGRHLRFRQRDVEAWIEQQRQADATRCSARDLRYGRRGGRWAEHWTDADEARYQAAKARLEQQAHDDPDQAALFPDNDQEPE